MATPRQLSRINLGALVVYNMEPSWTDSMPVMCMVVGCWRWAKDMKSREDMYNVCPREVDWGQGYLLLPNGQVGWIHAWFGDVLEGKLTEA